MRHLGSNWLIVSIGYLLMIVAGVTYYPRPFCHSPMFNEDAVICLAKSFRAISFEGGVGF